MVHPAAKMLVLASEMQDHECGDATNLVTIFGGELLAQAEPLVRMGLHPSEIVSGYKKAGKRALEILDSLVCSQVSDLRNEEEVARYLRAVISSKQFGYESFLGSLVAKACISVLDANDKKNNSFSVDNGEKDVSSFCNHIANFIHFLSLLQFARSKLLEVVL